MSLTREQILAVSDIKIEEVKVPQWGGSVFVKSMTSASRDQLEASMVEVRAGKVRSTKLEYFRAKLLAATLCDEKGNLLFTETDIPALAQKSAAAMEVLVSVAQRLSAISNKDVEEIASDLKKDQPGGSPSV